MDHQIDYIVCPSCLTTNKFAKEKLSSDPKCGKCGKQLFLGKPVKLNDRTFPKFVQKTTLPVVVDFWAEWCGPCKMMAPIFEQAAGNLEPRVMFAKLNTEEAPIMANEYGIRSIPTIAILENGKVINQTAGAMSLQNLTSWIESSI
jgi:thioredoxin 2